MKNIFIYTLLFSLFCFANQIMAQSVSMKEQNEIVNKVTKILGNQSDISTLLGKSDIYTFNIKIKLERKGKTAIIKQIFMTDSVGYRVFPNYNKIKSLNFRPFLTSANSINLIIPVLIRNKVERGSDTVIRPFNLNGNSLQSIFTSLLYPNILQQNVTIFPLLTITRLDIH